MKNKTEKLKCSWCGNRISCKTCGADLFPQETSPKECCDECRLPAESKFLCKGTCPCHTSSNEENGYEKKHCPNCKLDFLGIGFDSECPECETKFIAPSLEWEEQIKNWQFAACPTEESEPFYWKWTEHGMEMLKTYVKEIYSQALARGREEGNEAAEVKAEEYMMGLKAKIQQLKKESYNKFHAIHGAKEKTDTKAEGYNVACDDILQALKDKPK